MEYTEDADRRELLLHSAYDSDTVRAMERPLLDKGVPLMRMAAQAAAHMAAGMLDDEDLALEDTSIVLLAGAGDNGGDGLFAAAALAQEGANVTAIAVGRSLHEAGFASFVRAGGKVLVLDPAADIPGCASGFSAGEAASVADRHRRGQEIASDHRRDDRPRHPRLATRHPRPHSPPPLVSTARLPMSRPAKP